MKLRVWWIPQVPMTPFRVPVADVAQGMFLLRTLADYDRFQLEHRIKPDYCNVGGLEQWDDDEGEWLEWEDEDGRQVSNLLRECA